MPERSDGPEFYQHVGWICLSFAPSFIGRLLQQKFHSWFVLFVNKIIHADNVLGRQDIAMTCLYDFMVVTASTISQ